MRINFDDDVVKVIRKDTKEVVYKGLEDYEPMKREDWVYKDGQYEVTGNGITFIKTLIA